MRMVEAAGELQFPHLSRLPMLDSLVKVRRSEMCDYTMLWFIIVRSTMFGVLWSLSPNRNPCHGWDRGWLLQFSLKFILLMCKLMRAHSVTFSMLACHGNGWWNFTNVAFLSLRTHNLTFKVRLRNNQTARNVYCGCNNNAIFSDRAIFTFPTDAVCRPR